MGRGGLSLRRLTESGLVSVSVDENIRNRRDFGGAGAEQIN